MKSETLSATENNLIFIEHDKPYTREEVEEKLTLLNHAVESSMSTLSGKAIKRAMKRAVPTYKDPDEVNKDFDDSEEKKLSEDEESEVPANVNA